MYQLYRHFDSYGHLLYVGISMNSLCRYEDHSRTSRWADLVATITICRFESETEARAAEIRAIREENPIFNVMRPANQSKGAPKPPISPVNSALHRAITHVGTIAGLARLLNTRRQKVWKWAHGHSPVAPKSALEIERVTKGVVSAAELRPDLFAQRVDA